MVLFEKLKIYQKSSLALIEPCGFFATKIKALGGVEAARKIKYLEPFYKLFSYFFTKQPHVVLKHATYCSTTRDRLV